MGSICSQCGHDINDDTRDCPGCGHRVHEERLSSRLAIADEAIEGWRSSGDRIHDLQRELAEAKEMAGIGGACATLLTSVIDTESLNRLIKYTFGNACKTTEKEPPDTTPPA